MSKLLIIGAGGHGKVVAEIAKLSRGWNHVSFLDDKENLSEVVGLSIVGKCKDYGKLRNEYEDAFVAFGNNRLRMIWLKMLVDAGYNVPSLVHPASVISPSSKIGHGTVVMAGAVINAEVSIGNGCIINTSSSIDHDCVLQDGVHVSPGVSVGGTVRIGRETWLGIGSSVIHNLSIGSNAVVAAGATVIEQVPDSIMVAGVPARKVKVIN